MDSFEILRKDVLKNFKKEKDFYSKYLMLTGFFFFLWMIIGTIDTFTLSKENTLFTLGKDTVNAMPFSIITIINTIVLFFLIVMIIFCLVKFILLKRDYYFLEKRYFELLSVIIKKEYPNSEFEFRKILKNKNNYYERNIVESYDIEKISNYFRFFEDNNEYICYNSHLKGTTNNHSGPLFNGQIYILKSQKNIPYSIRIVSSTNKDKLNRDYNSNFPPKSCNENRIDVESQLFNENFEVFTKDEHYAFLILDAKLIESLLKLKEIYNEFEISIYQNEIMCLFPFIKELAMPINEKEMRKISLERETKKIKNVFNIIQDLEKNINI